MHTSKKIYILIFTIFFVSSVLAHNEIPSGVNVHADSNGHKPIAVDSHAPIGAIADHTHKAGEWMLSYQFRHMVMEDNLIDDDSVSPERIVTTIPNRFFGAPGQPPTLRVVPTEMTMDMHMFGGMYAPADWVTLMVMAMYMEKDMDHITFMGPAGTTRLGMFTTRSRGFGDTSVTGMFKIFDKGNHRLQLNAGLSLPTGSITETDDVLTPMGMTTTLRLTYAMQLGSGTYDLLPGIVYTGYHEKWYWSAQYAGTLRTGTNDENYTLGDKHLLTGRTSYRWLNWLSTSFRVEAEHAGQIDGIDPNIMTPVQTANPDNYGGKTVSIFFGMNLAGQNGALRGHRFALEVGFPVYQYLNGPQLGIDTVITTDWQYAF